MTTPRQVLAGACDALKPLAPTFLERERVPDQEPDLYVVIDLITDTPASVYEGEGGSFTLLQVTAWSRDRLGPALDLAEQIKEALRPLGFRRIQTRYPSEDLWMGAQADFKTP